jgi:hypothetical protein
VIAATLVGLIAAAAVGPKPTPSASPSPGPTTPGDLVANADAGLILFVIVALGAIGYFASLKLHPYSKCPRCKGKGIHRGGVYSFATRACSKCKGRGIQPRLGRRLFMSDKA